MDIIFTYISDIHQVLWALNIVLALGTVYAWYQFALVLGRQCDTCSVDLKASPFKSKCFVGAVFFSLALALSLHVSVLFGLFS